MLTTGLAQLWLDALATELGVSSGTIATYTDDLNCYLAWLTENSLVLDDVGLEQVRDYVADLDQRGYVGSTIARRITVVRGLQKFLIAEELGSHDPTSNLSTMRRARKLPFVLSISQTEALLETAHRLAADPSVGLYRQAGYARLLCSRRSMPRGSVANSKYRHFSAPFSVIAAALSH